MNYNASLVLEGGGMRGTFTAGVLEYFAEQEMYFKKNYGVSAGACNAMSYLSRQPGRNKRLMIDYINDKRYMSYKGLVNGQGLFNRSFIFGEIPFKLDPYDFDAFKDCDQDMYAVVTECRSGEAHYMDVKEAKNNLDMLKLILASSSLPYISRPVHYHGQLFMDGGLVDSIPIAHAMKNGFQKHVIIMTRERTYRKDSKSKKYPLTRTIYRQYSGLVKAIRTRDNHYNNTRDLIDELEEQGIVYPIYPSQPLEVSRIEKDQDKLMRTYEQGYEEAKVHYKQILTWLNNEE